MTDKWWLFCPCASLCVIHCSPALTNTSRHDSCSHPELIWAAARPEGTYKRGKHWKYTPSSYIPKCLAASEFCWKTPATLKRQTLMVHMNWKGCFVSSPSGLFHKQHSFKTKHATVLKNVQYSKSVEIIFPLRSCWKSSIVINDRSASFLFYTQGLNFAFSEKKSSSALHQVRYFESGFSEIRL